MFCCLLFFSFNALSYPKPSTRSACFVLLTAFSVLQLVWVNLPLPTLGLGWLRLALLNIVGGSKRKRETLPFSDQTPAFLCTDLYIIFVPPSNFFFFFFLSHAASNPSSSLSSPLLFSPLLTPLWLVGPFSPAILSSPALHPFMLCAWTKQMFLLGPTCPN